METALLRPSVPLVPGETYTLSYSYGNLVNGNVPSEYLGSGSVTFTVSGGQDQGTEEEPEAPEQPTVPGGTDNGTGASDGGAPTDDGSAPSDEGGSSDATEDASTDTSEESQQQSQQSDPSSSHSTISDSASSSQASQGASQQGSPSSEGADYATSDGSGEAGGSGIDEVTARAGQSGGAPQVSGTALAGMGSLYSLGGTGGAAMSGDESGDSASALALVITGLPYLWVVVVAMFLLALPSGFVGRLAAASRSAKGRSRLA